jgi:hypothetical protein
VWRIPLWVGFPQWKILAVPPDSHCVPFSIKRTGPFARYVQSL